MDYTFNTSLVTTAKNSSDYELTAKSIERSTSMTSLTLEIPGATPPLAPQDSGGIGLTTEKVSSTFYTFRRLDGEFFNNYKVSQALYKISGNQ